MDYEILRQRIKPSEDNNPPELNRFLQHVLRHKDDFRWIRQQILKQQTHIQPKNQDENLQPLNEDSKQMTNRNTWRNVRRKLHRNLMRQGRFGNSERYGRSGRFPDVMVYPRGESGVNKVLGMKYEFLRKKNGNEGVVYKREKRSDFELDSKDKDSTSEANILGQRKVKKKIIEEVKRGNKSDNQNKKTSLLTTTISNQESPIINYHQTSSKIIKHLLQPQNFLANPKQFMIKVDQTTMKMNILYDVDHPTSALEQYYLSSGAGFTTSTDASTKTAEEELYNDPGEGNEDEEQKQSIVYKPFLEQENQERRFGKDSFSSADEQNYNNINRVPEFLDDIYDDIIDYSQVEKALMEKMEERNKYLLHENENELNPKVESIDRKSIYDSSNVVDLKMNNPLKPINSNSTSSLNSEEPISFINRKLKFYDYNYDNIANEFEGDDEENGDPYIGKKLQYNIKKKVQGNTYTSDPKTQEFSSSFISKTEIPENFDEIYDNIKTLKKSSDYYNSDNNDQLADSFQDNQQNQQIDYSIDNTDNQKSLVDPGFPDFYDDEPVQSNFESDQYEPYFSPSLSKRWSEVDEETESETRRKRGLPELGFSVSSFFSGRKEDVTRSDSRKTSNENNLQNKTGESLKNSTDLNKNRVSIDGKNSSTTTVKVSTQKTTTLKSGQNDSVVGNKVTPTTSSTPKKSSVRITTSVTKAENCSFTEQPIQTLTFGQFETNNSTIELDFFREDLLKDLLKVFNVPSKTIRKSTTKDSIQCEDESAIANQKVNSNREKRDLQTLEEKHNLDDIFKWDESNGDLGNPSKHKRVKRKSSEESDDVKDYYNGRAERRVHYPKKKKFRKTRSWNFFKHKKKSDEFPSETNHKHFWQNEPKQPKNQSSTFLQDFNFDLEEECYDSEVATNDKKCAKCNKLNEAINGNLAQKLVQEIKRAAVKNSLSSRRETCPNRKSDIASAEAFRRAESEKHIHNTEEMLHQLMLDINKIVKLQVHHHLCQKIAPELTTFLKRIVHPKDKIKRDDNNINIPDESLQADTFLFKTETPPEITRREMVERLKVLRSLLKECNELPEENRKMVQPVRVYLEKNLKALRSLLERSRRNEKKETRMTKLRQEGFKRDDRVRKLEQKLIDEELDKMGLGKRSEKSMIDVDKIVRDAMKSTTETMGNLMKTNREMLKEGSSSNWEDTKSYKKLVELADEIRKKRESEERIGKLYRKQKAVTSDVKTASFETPLVLTLD